MSEQEDGTEYRAWLDTHMDVKWNDDMKGGFITCKEHGNVGTFITPPNLGSLEVKTIFHMATKHAEDYDRIVAPYL